MANESVMQAFDRFTAHVLSLIDDMKIENDNKYATKEYADEHGSKIDKILVNENEQAIGAEKEVNIDLTNYATKEYADGKELKKISVNGEEQAIVDNTVDLIIPIPEESISDNNIYLTGVDKTDNKVKYADSVHVNPVNGELTAVAINADKVYGAVWNDYAEWFEKQNIEDEFEPGDICAWDTTGVIKANSNSLWRAVGVCSDSYGHILGGENLENMEENLKKFVPIGLIGRVKVKVLGKVNIGDYIISSNVDGVGIVDNSANLKYVIGQALEYKNSDGIDRITVLIK